MTKLSIESLAIRYGQRVGDLRRLVEEAENQTDLGAERIYVYDARKVDSWWLRRARIAAGIKQVEMAEALGVTQTSISRYETGVCDIDLPELLALIGELRAKTDAAA